VNDWQVNTSGAGRPWLATRVRGRACEVAALVPHSAESHLAGRADDGRGGPADLALPVVTVSLEPTAGEVVTAVSAALAIEVTPLRARHQATTGPSAGSCTPTTR
jgi:hypothetical protein